MRGTGMRGGWRAPVVALSVAAIALAGSERASAAATQLTVCQSGCAYSSIQAAIDAADNGGTIKIAAGTYDGALSIDKSITLVGADAAQTTITQSGLDSVVTISSGASVTIKAVTVSGGYAVVCIPLGGIPACFGSGGGIDNFGTLTLKDTAISGNTAITGGGIQNSGAVNLFNSTVSGNAAVSGGGSASNGGGIYNSGTANFFDSTVSGNSASDGGGIYNLGGGTLTLYTSTVSGNTNSPTLFGTRGGGILNLGTLTLNNSTVSGNTTGFGGEGGGGIDNSGTLTLNNSTVVGNSGAFFGGGINNSGTVSLLKSTVRDNSAAFGGGIFNVGALALDASRIIHNTAQVDGGGIDNSGGTVSALSSMVKGNAPNDLVGV